MTEVPDALASFLVTRLGADEELLASVELATLVPLQATGAPTEKAPLWLVLTSRRAILAAALDADRRCMRDWPHDKAEIAHIKGVVRDSVKIADEVHDLPIGGGAAAKEILAQLPGAGETAAPAAEATEPTEPPPAALDFARAGQMWLDKLPPAVAAAIARHIQDGEAVLGALQTATEVPPPVSSPLWFVVTTETSALCAVTEDVEGDLWQPLRRESLSCTRQVTRDRFELDEETIFDGPLIGAGALRQLFELATLPTPQRLKRAGDAHADKGAWAQAVALYDQALAHFAPTEGPERASVHAMSARAYHAMERDALAFEALAKASASDPDDDQLGLSAALGLKDKAWKVSLAMAHQSMDNHAAAAAVYADLLEDDARQDVFLLQRARNLRDAGAHDDALSCFDAFIRGRLATEEDFFLLDNDIHDEALAAACLECGRLLESLDRSAEAAQRYLELIRRAPYLEQGYERLFTLSSLLPEARFTIGQASTILALLKPTAAQAIEEKIGHLPSPTPPAKLPVDYRPLSKEAHDARVIHPSEKATSAMAQKWVGAMVSEDPQTAEIERHCQKIDAGSHPELRDLIARIAHLLQVPTPRCFLSHGNTGVQVLGKENPFILMGSAHTDPESERHLDTTGMAFAIGAQLEHIKAGHLMLTSSEFWTSFGNRSLEGLMTVVSLIPAASWLGKLTDGVALKWVGKLQTQVESKNLMKFLTMAEQQVKDGKVGEGAQSLIEGGLNRLRSADKPADRSESLAKEQLADFARGALCTSDRAGLLACDDLRSCVAAIFRLSPSAIEELPAVERHGLAHVLSLTNSEGRPVYTELAFRLAELFKFALSEDYAALRAETFSS